MPTAPFPIRRACLIVVLLLLAATHVAAHAGSVAFWRITINAASARSEILIALDDIGRTRAAVLTASGPVSATDLGAFGAALLTHFVIQQDDMVLPARILAAEVLPSGLLQVRVEHAIRDASRPFVVRATLHALTDDTHRVIGRFERDGIVTAMVFDATTPQHAVAARPARSWREATIAAGSMPGMLLLGIEHILTGYDHLVFLLCLLLAGGTWRSRLGIVSAFTVAHSITLVLAAMRVVTPPSGFVEPAIAITIAYVALENLIVDPQRSRWATAFGFGLIHGFGFATLLDVLDLPFGQWVAAVLAFNIGVEIGQLAVVAVAMPVVIVIARSSWHTRFVRYASSAVLGLAVVWFVERLQ
jgi:hypothetical protein